MVYMSTSLYRAATYAGYPLIAAYLAYRKARGKEDLERFPERMGIAGHPRPEGRLIWIHGASVGETLSMLPLVRKIEETYPDLNILVTSGTVTSARLMEQRLGGKAFHQYIPIDCMPQVRRFVDYWKPDAAFWLESEFWPNILSVIAEKNIPLVLLNGRVSDRSFKRWRSMPGFAKQIQELFVKSFGQTQEDADRLKVLGAKDTACVGNIKFAAGELPYDAGEMKRLEKQTAGRSVWTAASTHAGEEGFIAAAHKEIKHDIPGLLTVLAPRHPNRGNEVEDLLKAAGLKVARRSRKEDITPETDVYLADTIGEMGLFYRLGAAAFVGGSLIPFGGQNIIEPARLKKAVLCGPYMMNFKEIVARAQAADALISVPDAQGLTENVKLLLTDKKLLAEKQKNALAFATAEANVLERLVPALEPYLSFKD